MREMGGMTGLLLLLWVGVTVSTAVNLQKRAIGGRDCNGTERLYHVKLKISNGTDAGFCGGSLISERWILTAAHCFKNVQAATSNGVRVTITAYLGVHPIGQNPPGIPITAPPKIFHDQYGDHDLMLLKLPNASTITNVTLPDCAPQKLPSVGTLVQIAGHASKTMGPNNERQPGESTTLQCADIDVVNCTTLRKTLATYHKKFYQVYGHQHWGCIQTPGVDICLGDSGGGVIYNDKIYGVISFTGDGTYACAKPAVFLDICNSEYNKWIRNTIAK